MAELRVGLRAALHGVGAERDKALEKLKLADQLGYDSLWLDETWGEDVVTAMTEAVHATSQIQIGGLMNVFSRSAGTMASTFGTLDAISGGRMIILLATSGANVIEHYHGIPYEKPLRRLREYVEIINLLISGQRLIYKGELLHEMSRGFRLQVDRARDHIPVYIASISPVSIVQTGEIADGIIPIHWPKNRYGTVRERLDRGAKKAGRSGSDITIAPYLTTGIITDESQREEVTRKAKQPVAWYIGRMGIFYKQMLAREGYADEVPVIEAAWENGQDAAIDAVPQYMNDNIAVVGTPKELHTQLLELQTLGVDLPLISMPSGDPDEAGRVLEEIIKG